MAKKKILVVEDDPDIRDAVSELLQDAGYEVLLSDNGADALSQLREQPDVRAIVLDLMMPVMNGATFRGEQLADPTIASIPLILLTGREDIRPIARALEATACLQKPLSGEDLLRALSDLH